MKAVATAVHEARHHPAMPEIRLNVGVRSIEVGAQGYVGRELWKAVLEEHLDRLGQPYARGARAFGPPTRRQGDGHAEGERASVGAPCHPAHGGMASYFMGSQLEREAIHASPVADRLCSDQPGGCDRRARSRGHLDQAAPVLTSKRSGSGPPSARQRNSPAARFVTAQYSRSARVLGGSPSSSLIALELAMMVAPFRAWLSAERASSLNFGLLAQVAPAIPR